VGGEAPVTPVSSPDSSSLDLSYKPCDNNIGSAVSTLSQFMVDSRHFHWVATKHVLRYLRGIVGYGLRYVLGGEVTLHG
jgi:hypothetical protein